MDLFSDLPPASGEESATASKPKAVAPAGWLMPPPVRRPQPRPIASVSKPLPSARASSSSSLEPNRTPEESHIDSINVHTRLASPVLQNVSNQQRDAYDPSRPNDYMAYCTERVQRKRDEEAKRELEKYRQEEERRLAEERAQEAPIAVGRGRGRGLSNLPAWMVKQLSEDSSGDGSRTSPTQSTGAFEDAEPNDGSNNKKGIGSRLLAKLGYREGTGLGKDEQGITRAIQHRPTGGGQGRITGPPPSSTSAGPTPLASPVEGGAVEIPKRRKRGLFSNPSRVLLLKNMVGPGEVDPDLQAETAEECHKFGPVKQCVIHEIKDSAVPDEERVLTFVFFEKQESAVKAYVDMGGRFFGGRQIQASFYEEERFVAGDYV